MQGSFFSGSRHPEHRFSDDDLVAIRRCVDAIDKVIKLAELECAEETGWQLHQIKAGLESILRMGKVLLGRGGDGRDGVRYEAE